MQAVVEKIMTIEFMTMVGAQQLAQDLQYLLKVAGTFCEEPVMELINFISVFERLSKLTVFPEGMEAPAVPSSVNKTYESAMKRWFVPAPPPNRRQVTQ